MIKLLIVIPTLDQSGAEKQLGLLACRLPRDEFDVRVVALNRGGPYEQVLRDQGLPVQILHKRGRFDPRSLLQLRSLIRNWQPDALLSALFSANASIRLACWNLSPRPFTIISERCVDSWKSGWQKWLDRRLRTRLDRLAANSASVAKFYEDLGVDPARIVVIPNGVEPPPAPALTRSQLLEDLHLPADAQLVAYVGRLAPQKRLPDLIWGAQLLRQFDPRAHLLIIGDGPLRGELEYYARDVEVSRHVHFLGHRADAASLLHLVDVFWLGSEFEGMSNSLMEAMSCGRPVVVSDIPPNRELVRHGQDGWLVNLGDSPGFAQFTSQLLRDSALAQRMGESGAQRMREGFSVTAMVQRYAELIRSGAGAQRESQ